MFSLRFVSCARAPTSPVSAIVLLAAAAALGSCSPRTFNGGSAAKEAPLSAPVPSTGEAKETATTPGSVTFRLDFPAGTCGLAPRELTFAPYAGVLSRAEAGLALWASVSAYASEGDVKKAGLAVGFQSVTFVSAGDGFQGFVGIAPGLRVLAIRGSSEAADWVVNANDTTREGKAFGLPGWIHRGYAGQADKAWKGVREALATGNARAPILVTGHSLGGAVAQILGMRLVKEGAPVSRIVTFASPRAGDTAFAAGLDALGARYVRILREDDFVPRIAPNAENAALGAQALHPAGPDSSVATDAEKFRRTHYAHAGRALALDPDSGALKLLPPPGDAGDAAFFETYVREARAAIAAGTDAKKAFDAKVGEHHNPTAYVCPFFRSEATTSD